MLKKFSLEGKAALATGRGCGIGKAIPRSIPLRTLALATLMVLAIACRGSFPEGGRILTATPRVFVPRSTLTPTAADLLGLAGFRFFPEELEFESRQLDPKSVEEAWVEFLAGSRLVNDRTAAPRYDLCSDHTGAWRGNDLPAGVTFTWRAVRVGDEPDWNSITVIIEFDNLPGAAGSSNARFLDVHSRERGGFVGPLRSPVGDLAGELDGQRLFFDSPSCD